MQNESTQLPAVTSAGPAKIAYRPSVIRTSDRKCVDAYCRTSVGAVHLAADLFCPEDELDLAAVNVGLRAYKVACRG